MVTPKLPNFTTPLRHLSNSHPCLLKITEHPPLQRTSTVPSESPQLFSPQMICHSNVPQHFLPKISTAQLRHSGLVCVPYPPCTVLSEENLWETLPKTSTITACLSHPNSPPPLMCLSISCSSPLKYPLVSHSIASVLGRAMLCCHHWGISAFEHSESTLLFAWRSSAPSHQSPGPWSTSVLLSYL